MGIAAIYTLPLFQKMVSDSNLSLREALQQNPDSTCPHAITKTLGLLTVEYVSLDKQFHAGQIVVAQSVMAEVEAFFRHAEELNFPIDKVIPASHPNYSWDEEKLMAGNVSSGFNYRLIAGTSKSSLHGQGRAFDINPRQNPYIRYSDSQVIIKPEGAVWNKAAPGTLYAEHPLVRMMEGFGWEWGGHWTPESGRTDYQHFQKVN